MKQPLHLRIAVLLVLFAGLAACSTTSDGRLVDIPLSEQPLNGKFVWHDLITNDVAAVKEFYGELFGWRFEATRHPNGGDYTLILKDSHWVGGIVQLADPDGADYSRWLGYLSVPDVDEAVAYTRSAGGSAVAGPLDLSNIGRAAAIKDPQSAVVGLVRSNHGDPSDSIERGLGEIIWNELVAADAQGAAEYYAGLSGALARSTVRQGRDYRVLASGGRDRSGILQRPDDAIDPFWLTHFAVADPAVAAEHVARLGGEVLLAPHAEVFNATVAVVTDPTGAVLALHKLPVTAEASE